MRPARTVQGRSPIATRWRRPNRRANARLGVLELGPSQQTREQRRETRKTGSRA